MHIKIHAIEFFSFFDPVRTENKRKHDYSVNRGGGGGRGERLIRGNIDLMGDQTLVDYIIN